MPYDQNVSEHPGIVLCVDGWPWDARLGAAASPGAPGSPKAVGPSPGPPGSSLVAQQIHQTAKCKQRFQPCREGWAGTRSALPHPPCFSEAFVFLEISTFLTFCVLLCRFLSFFPSPQLDFGCKFFSTVQVCAYVHITVKCLHRNT